MKRLASLLTVAALVATACSSSTTTPVPGASVAGSAAPTTASQATPVNGGNLVVGLDGDMVFADPSLVSDGNSLEVAAQVVEGLVGLKRSEEDTSGLPARQYLACRLLLEKRQ